MSNYIVDGADLTSVANAIRTKGGTSAQLAFPAGFVSAIGDIPTGGGGGEYAVVDVIVDNISTQYLQIPFDTTYDNYVVSYAVVETGVYADGVLTIDETPNVPGGYNLPLSGLLTKLTPFQAFSGIAGATTLSDNAMCHAYAVVRASNVSTYGISYISARDILTQTGIRVMSEYYFGKTGYYFKYRCLVRAWNDGQEQTLNTITVV